MLLYVLFFCFYPQKKNFKKQEKRKNMQQKYLHPWACSSKTHHVFLWADLGLRKKREEKEKRENSKRFTVAKKQKIKKEKKKKKKDISARGHLCQLKRGQNSQKQNKKGITDTDSVQEKQKEEQLSKIRPTI